MRARVAERRVKEAATEKPVAGNASKKKIFEKDAAQRPAARNDLLSLASKLVLNPANGVTFDHCYRPTQSGTYRRALRIRFETPRSDLESIASRRKHPSLSQDVAENPSSDSGVDFEVWEHPQLTQRYSFESSGRQCLPGSIDFLGCIEFTSNMSGSLTRAFEFSSIRALASTDSERLETATQSSFNLMKVTKNVNCFSVERVREEVDSPRYRRHPGSEAGVSLRFLHALYAKHISVGRLFVSPTTLNPS